MADRNRHSRIYTLSAKCGRRFLLVFALLAGSVTILGQNVIDDNIAPPPLRLISQDERDKLAAETDVKDRTKLTLQLMDSRLAQSETLASAQNYDSMFTELGGFHGLMDNLLEFLNGRNKDSRKVISNFKRFEMGLRGFTPRLELLRRDVPIRYELYVRNLIKNLRAARAKAVEPLFDDTVVPVAKPKDGDDNDS